MRNRMYGVVRGGWGDPTPYSIRYLLDVIIERPGSLRRYKVRVLFEFAAKVSAAGP